MTPQAQDKAKLHLLEQVRQSLKQRFGATQLSQKLEWLEVFWSQLPLDDWRHREVSDIAGCVESLWLLLAGEDNPPRVQVVNPTIEEHGWISGGTVIMVRQRDMPFLVDSVRLELNRRDLSIHTIKSTLVWARRDQQGLLEALQRPQAHKDVQDDQLWQQEAVMFIEVGLLVDPLELNGLREAVVTVLDNVQLVVNDYPAIDQRSKNLLAQWSTADSADINEVKEFLQWLANSHFTYLGYRELDYLFDDEGQPNGMSEVGESRLGLFKKYVSQTDVEHAISDASLAFYHSDEWLAISKSSTRSSVHRSVYPDYIVVKRLDGSGKVIGEARLLGLFTYSVYTLDTDAIPIVRTKVQRILEKSQVLPQSHDGKNLRRVIETYPRDELFQADFESLYDSIMRIAVINEKGAVRLITRIDPFGNFVYCVAYVPRDSYNTDVRQRIEALVGSAIDAEEFDSTTYFSESVLARAYIVFRLKHGSVAQIDTPTLETSVDEIARGWRVRLAAALIDHFGEREGQALYQTYKSTFTLGYQETFDPRSAVGDIDLMRHLSETNRIAMHFFQPVHAAEREMRFRVLHFQDPLELSDVVPILEHLGLRVRAEHPHELRTEGHSTVWLHDFYLDFGLDCSLEVATVARLFEGAFAAIWRGDADSDGFNRLVLGARLEWREVAMLRAYAAYMKQTTFAFGQDYIADTLVKHAEITRNLVALFKISFDPRITTSSDTSVSRVERIQEKVINALIEVENLNEDKILRRYIELFNATLRTNFYQFDETGNPKNYQSFKFHTKQLSDIPSPKPEFEIYVFSPRMEGVHLRGGKVARGGVRWSDRLQDYRTEILGLVKAQQVKNAVIVPAGAKGGFICKRQYLLDDRDAIAREGIECYKTLIRGLLDITDNLIDGEIQPPEAVICKDEPDPYLVVAADKGTSTFSDVANAISEEYRHWLGDAFASGGSQGYDHKKMGITARGAWISVQRHFRERGVDVQTTPISVVGIGDMAGDVFGNGMLLSQKIRLVAAFNHLHIFIDPNPDSEKSFEERRRLFELPRSAWSDYDKSLISKGGGVFQRSAKSINITEQMREIFDISEHSLTPNELIRKLLQAPVDLIWNGGIGTYVKHSQQAHIDVGDKANDVLRVDGAQLRCRVFGEGGNLGMTQLGRVEYALNGGACNTDFIDNAGGVDCSDHEVNIKILLQGATDEGDLTQKQRNQLLEDMTAEVAKLVLDNNYRQTLALSLAQFQVHARASEFARFMRDLERKGRLDRKLEFLPDDASLQEREKDDKSFTRPELAMLLSYAKVELKEAFIAEDLTDQDILVDYVTTAFPALLVERFEQRLRRHPLLKEIVATQVANDAVHVMGISSAQRLAASTGASLKQVALAFVMAKDVFCVDAFFDYIRGLDNQLAAGEQYKLISNMARRVRRGARWFLRNRRGDFDPAREIKLFREGLSKVNEVVPKALEHQVHERWHQTMDELNEQEIDQKWRLQLAVPDYLFSGLGAVEVANRLAIEPARAGLIFFALYGAFELDWLAEKLNFMPVDNSWQAKARETYLDELDNQLQILTGKLFAHNPKAHTLEEVHSWTKLHTEPVARWHKLLGQVKSEGTLDFAVFSVLIGELVDCVNNRINTD